MWLIHLLANGAGWALAGVFAVSSVHKLVGYTEFRSVLAQYRIIPNASVPLAASLVVALECTASLTLAVPAWRFVGAPLAASLLVLYSAAIAINLYGRGRTAMDCGCGGAPTPLSGWLLLRNGLMTLLACSLLLAAPSFAIGGGIEAALAALIAILLWLAYAIGNQLLANLGGSRALGAVHG